jgi:hypothetical protein
MPRKHIKEYELRSHLEVVRIAKEVNVKFHYSTSDFKANIQASNYSNRKFASSKIASAPCILHAMATSSEKPLSKYVTLISSDGFEFVVLREAACKSGTIKKMLNPKSES